MKRILLIYPWSNLDSVPSLYNTAVLLARKGYLVDVLTRDHKRHVKPNFELRQITIVPFDRTASLYRQGMWKVVPRRYQPWLRTSLQHLRSKYSCIIGVDPQGLIYAASLGRVLHIPFIYYSLELLLSHEVQDEHDRKLKEQEREFSRQAAFIIIQDHERASLLGQDNQISQNKFALVPNAPLGPARTRSSNYLRERFRIPSDKKIILHTGSLAGFACINDVFRSVRGWSTDWVLVCHTRYRIDDQDYMEALKYLAGEERVIFSTEPLPATEYFKVVSSADVGIATYCVRPNSTYTGDNIRHIGLSSGKFAYYLWAGVPVIVNGIQPLRRLVEEYKCGASTTCPTDTRVAIEQVLAGGQEFRQNAVRCFNENLDFESAFEQVIQRLENL